MAGTIEELPLKDGIALYSKKKKGEQVTVSFSP